MPRFAWLGRAAFLWLALAGCGPRERNCLGGDDGRCRPPPACPERALSTGCGSAGGFVRVGRVERMGATSHRALGPKAVAAEGDFVLENDLVRVVIDAPAHPQGLAPSGGGILDLSLREGGDQVNGFYQAAGVLPRDAVRYHTAEMIDGAPRSVALIVRGHLDGDRRVEVVTRYELRPCEAGVRIRTELWNGSREVNTFYLADGFFWGDRGMVPFVPLRGQGFRHPELDLLELAAAWRSWPFLVARPQAEPFVAYGIVPCDPSRGSGFNDPTLSASGIPLGPTLSQDARLYERFVFAAPGPGLSAAVGEALRARAELFGEPPPVRVRGRAVAADGAGAIDGGLGSSASVLFFEPARGDDPDDPAGRTPWSEAAPDLAGDFQVELPPGRAFRAQPHAFGRPAGPAVAFTTGSDGATVALEVPFERPARLVVSVQDDRSAPVAFAELVLLPVEPTVVPSFYGQFPNCPVMLGPPDGASPACNRALVVDGRIDLLVPPGRHHVYATRGPHATLAHALVSVAAGAEEHLLLRSWRLPLLAAGVLSGDFHVHGAASFDSSLPERDRVASFLAAGVDVIAATDHDVVTTYAEALTALGAGDKLIVMPGAEMTPNLLWFDVPGEEFPKTLGHFNFWPLRHDAFSPRNGAPWDERIEPGAIMDAIEPLFSDPRAAVRQMNHPWSSAKLGRDQGFLRAIGYDPRTPIIGGRSFAAAVLSRRPAQGRGNLDFDVQEVMTGANVRDWIRARALWFSFLNQGILRAGVANSDTHTFAIEQAGYPRTLVRGPHALVGFDPVAFNRDLREGRLVGSNGPVLDARIEGAGGLTLRPVLTGVAAPAGAQVIVEVGVAPWIPVSEVRFVVNGRLVKTVPVPLDDGRDPFGAGRNATITEDLDALLAGVPGDAWLVVEAGLALPPAADLDDDGLVETLDNNGDGRIDGHDIPADPDEDDLRFPNPSATVESDARFHLQAIAPGTWPYAFTNPFLLDRDGGGWSAPGL